MRLAREAGVASRRPETHLIRRWGRRRERGWFRQNRNPPLIANYVELTNHGAWGPSEWDGRNTVSQFPDYQVFEFYDAETNNPRQQPVVVRVCFLTHECLMMHRQWRFSAIVHEEGTLRRRPI